MKILPTLRDASSWLSLVAAVILCTGISGELGASQLAAAAERPVQASQALVYMRRRQRPMTGHRGYRSSRVGNLGYNRFGVGAFRHAPWYPGGYYYPPVQGSWYQRPYPYHFDIYRGQPTQVEEIVPDAVR